MNAKALVFDFNGTLFFDYRENEEAWQETSLRYTGRTLDDFSLIAGMTDTAGARKIVPDASDKLIEEIWHYKESLYKRLCIEHGLRLAEGVEEFIRRAMENGITLAISSSAPKINMEWYIPYLALDRLFDPSLIIAGHEEIPSKPAPDLFIYTLKILSVSASDAICFEDSPSGLRGAILARFNKVYAIESPGIDRSLTQKIAPLVSWAGLLENFNDVISLC